MDLKEYLSIRRKQHQRSSSESTQHLHRPRLPLIASPINEHIRQFMLTESSRDLEKALAASTSDATTSVTTLATSWRTSSGNPIIYKQHHESSTIELFYDLFLVGNLAYFTAMHQHTDSSSLINYIKLFTLMWFTWLSTTLFDARFSIDCVWNRINKAIQLGCMVGFVFAGPVFDKYDDKHGDEKAYKRFALVMMISRIMISAQYVVVMWQGRMFRQTLVPVGLSALVHACSAVAFLITHFVYPKGPIALSAQIVWVVVAIIEGLLIFLIAMIWRIISFKYTHLVERFQLLTLIIIGEGIIGMVKSVACITKGQSVNNTAETGTVIAAVLLLYLMWMLYFDQLSDDRFGTVRQQIWSLLHYPLHIAIILCVEGSTSLIVWNSAVQALKWIWGIAPKDYEDPAAGFSNPNEYVSHLIEIMQAINARFPGRSWNEFYHWEQNITAINTYTGSYGFQSDDWNSKTETIVRYMFNSAQVFAFEAHAETLAKLRAVAYRPAEPPVALRAILNVFNVTVLQFYAGAAAMLLVLALMYWFNKLHKTKYEFGEMISRIVMGFGLVVVGVGAVLVNNTVTGFKVRVSAWIIPIVVFGFIIVLAFDNILLAFSHRKANRNDEESPRSRIEYSEQDGGRIIIYTPHTSQIDLGTERRDFAHSGRTSRIQSPDRVTLWDNNSRRCRSCSRHHSRSVSSRSRSV